MSTGDKLLRESLAGVAAGLAGTAVMFAVRSFDQRYAADTVAKTTDDPGHFMVTRGERALSIHLPDQAERGAIMASHLAYGTTFGLLYALLHLGRPGRVEHPLLTGGLLGVAVYAAGYLGWLPAVGLVRPAWRQSFPQVAGELARHAAYGVATAAAYGAIHNAC